VKKDGRFVPVRRLSESPWLGGGIALLATVAALLAKVNSDGWVLPVVLVLLAVGGVVLPVVGARAKQREANQEVLRNASAALIDGSLPTVNQVGLDAFRVHAAGVDLPYLRRDRQGELRDRLVEGLPVLVVGHSMSGKTRMAVEVVRELYGAWPVWIPERPDGVGELLAKGQPPNAVVWLDDLESFLTASKPCTAASLRTLRDADCRVVATIRTSEYDKFQPTGEIRPPQLDTLQQFRVVRLDDVAAEQDAIADHVADEQTANGIRRYGLAEYVGGGYLAIERFKNGEDLHPLGVAMLRAVADWHRLGFESMPDVTLAGLAPDYLSAKTRANPGETDQQATEWATEQIGGRIQLLEPVHPGWTVFDYLRDHLAQTVSVTPLRMWAAALTAIESDPERGLTLGFRAYEQGQKESAVQAFRIASTITAMAAFNLGVLLAEQGDVPGARAAYQVAIDSGDADAAPEAGVNLGALLAEQGDVEGARAVYQVTVDSGHADAAPKAAVNLGVLLAEEGDVPGARAAYQVAVDSGDAEAAPPAALGLGVLLAEEGDVPGARAAYQVAVDSGDAAAAPKAAFYLGGLLAEEGDVPGARAAYQVAIDSGHADATPKAALGLGVLLAEQGDVEGARAAYQVAVDSGHAQIAPPAALGLGGLLKEEGDVEGARAAYQVAVDSGDADAAPRAAVNLGILLTQQGDVSGARAAFQMAIDSGHAEAAPPAALNLGILLTQQGDVPGTKAAFQAAVDSGDADAAPKSAFSLGMLLAEQGDVEGARAAYQVAIDSGHAEAAPPAALNLGILLAQQGDVEGARAAFQVAIDSGHAEAAPPAVLNLGILLAQQGDVEDARAAFQMAIDSGHADAAPKGAVNLGILLTQQGDVSGARAAFKLADSAHANAAALWTRR